MHIVAVAHDTPASRRAVPAGFGLATTDQLEPFHRSISVLTVKPLKKSPTAKQFCGLVHDTCRKRLSELPWAITDQLVPFHRSMSVRSCPSRW